MDYLLLVDVVEGVADFEDDFPGKRLGDPAFADKAFKGMSVNPLHRYAMSYFRKFCHAEILAYVDVVQGGTYIEILLEQFLIERIPAIFFLQRLVDNEPSVLASAIQFAEPIRRTVDELKAFCGCKCTAGDVGQEKSG